MITAILAGDRALLRRLDGMPPAIHAALAARVEEIAAMLEDRVRGKLEGDVLQRRSGALWSSIASAVADTPDGIAARVFSAGDLKYAAIQEYGGRIPPHEIRPSKAEALAFVLAGKPVFAKRVRFPGALMPERSYLRASLDDLAAEIAAGLKAAVASALREVRR